MPGFIPIQTLRKMAYMIKTGARRLATAAACCFTLLFHPSTATACSTALIGQCDEVVTGRTMDYTCDQHTLIATVPKGSAFHFGKTSYNFLTFNGFGQEPFPAGMAAHGINERGLSIAYLWLNPTKYPDHIDPKKRNINVLEFMPFVLGTMSSVDEIEAFFANGGDIDFVNIPGQVKALDLLHQHFYCVDASGNSLIIEWIRGKRHSYRNQSPVLVNDPPFPEQKREWARQLATGRDILNREYNLASVSMHLPSRRYELLRRLTEQCLPTTGIDNVTKAFQVMKRVTYPPISPYKPQDVDWTLYTAVFVHKDGAVKAYYSDVDNAAIRMLDFATLDWSAPKLFPIATGPKFIDMTPAANGMKAGK